ncbi:HTH-type transcriptional activator IlvY [Endozoicomonas sp. G2_1]|uniref:HTH-type transcriptional activator IlvY n=1 Tax=Endozoicomonas sp. G2_1 TaxID=2821091 RepID=UPI001ADC0EAD|nr:HTH-type transcriptional activator IlvY [Endozoicomonas sp. G2_1]MBO9490459.1 HTH-type transcriptional activator IlvY [Endozoicomonas sp. G2_1]
MDTKSLKMFQQLATSLHFSQTAELYHVSPSTLSRAIQRLEQELGCTLLHRDNRSVSLTSAGIELKAFADQYLEQYQLLQLKLNQQQAELTGKLHIYCSVTAAYSHLPKLIDSFRQQHPLVEIMLTTGDAADALQQVQQQAVDLAIAAKPDNLSGSYYFHPIAQIPLALIAPTVACHTQQVLQAESINWSQVPIILPEHGSARSRFEQWYRKLQFGKPNIYATVSGHEAIVSMVALGCGVGIAPKVVVDNSPVKDRVYYLSEKHNIAPFELGICCLNIRKEQPLVQAFLQSISQ